MHAHMFGRNPLCDRGYLRTQMKSARSRARLLVAIPFVIGAIFGRQLSQNFLPHHACRNPLCDRGYLRTEVDLVKVVSRDHVAIPFVIGAIFGQVSSLMTASGERHASQSPL